MPANAWSAATAGSKPAAVFTVPALPDWLIASVVASFAPAFGRGPRCRHVAKDAFSTNTLGFRDRYRSHSRICQVFWSDLTAAVILGAFFCDRRYVRRKVCWADSCAAAMSGREVIAVSPMKPRILAALGSDLTFHGIDGVI